MNLKRSFTPNWGYIPVLTSAFLLVGASAGFGAHYAWSTGSANGPVLASLAVAMALGLELSKGFAFDAALTAARSWQPVRCLSLGILAALAVSYSLTAELALMATTRADITAQRLSQGQQTHMAKAAAERADKELATLAPTRTVAELAAAVTAKLSTRKDLNDCVGWLPSTAARSVCVDVSNLRAELGRAQRRQTLEAERSRAEETLAANALAGTVEKVADPASKAIAVYLQDVMGVTTTPDRVADWLLLIGVIALEAGSVLSVLLVKASTPITPDATVIKVINDVAVKSQETPENAGPTASDQRDQLPSEVLTVADRPADRLLALLKDRGGKVISGQRTLGKALGVSQGTVHNLLAELQASGAILVAASRRGTVVSLPSFQATALAV